MAAEGAEGRSDACEPEVVGWVERVRLYPGGIGVRAKLDTGANTSSLHAEAITFFRRSGARWVRFTVVDRLGRRHRVEAPVVRTLRIRRAAADLHERPLVRLGVSLGTHYGEAEVNLVDRAYMNYDMLLGRSFLAGKVAVDPSRTFATTPRRRPPAALRERLPARRARSEGRPAGS